MAEPFAPAAAPRREMFPDGSAVPLSRLQDRLGDGRPRRDGPAPKQNKHASGGRRSVKGESAARSNLQQLEAAAALAAVWTLASPLDESLDNGHRGGRPRQYQPADMIVFEIAAVLYGSARRAAANLADPKNWHRLRAAAAAAWPDNPRRRLSQRAPTRSQHHRFRGRLAEEDLLDGHQQRLRDQCALGAKQIGLFNPKAGSFVHPHRTQTLVGDGTWLAAKYRNTDPEAVNPRTGRRRRIDPDAVPYHTSDRKRATSPGHLVALLMAHNLHTQERIIIDTRIKHPSTPQPLSDATMTTDMTLSPISEHPRLARGIHALCYDMAITAKDKDRLQDVGLHAIAKIQLTPKGLPATQALGLHTFTAPNRHKSQHEVIAADGTPAIVSPKPDADGVHHLIPLRRVTTTKNPHRANPHHCTIYAPWAVPDTSHTDSALHGATCRIRHSSTAEERTATPHRRRTRTVATIPTTDPDFAKLYGGRESVESANNHLKETLRHGRSRVVGHHNLQWALAGYQLHTLLTALLAHQHRTHRHLPDWFGRPPP